MCCLERKAYTPGLVLSPQPMPKEVIPTCTPLHIRGPPESPYREIDENTGMYSNPPSLPYPIQDIDRNYRFIKITLQLPYKYPELSDSFLQFQHIPCQE